MHVAGHVMLCLTHSQVSLEFFQENWILLQSSERLETRWETITLYVFTCVYMHVHVSG